MAVVGIGSPFLPVPELGEFLEPVLKKTSPEQSVESEDPTELKRYEGREAVLKKIQDLETDIRRLGAYPSGAGKESLKLQRHSLITKDSESKERHLIGIVLSRGDEIAQLKAQLVSMKQVYEVTAKNSETALRAELAKVKNLETTAHDYDNLRRDFNDLANRGHRDKRKYDDLRNDYDEVKKERNKALVDIDRVKSKLRDTETLRTEKESFLKQLKIAATYADTLRDELSTLRCDKSDLIEALQKEKAASSDRALLLEAEMAKLKEQNAELQEQIAELQKASQRLKTENDVLRKAFKGGRDLTNLLCKVFQLHQQSEIAESTT